MLPRFADIFQQGNRWLNWLHKQPEGSVRPAVIEAGEHEKAWGNYQIASGRSKITGIKPQPGVANRYSSWRNQSRLPQSFSCSPCRTVQKKGLPYNNSLYPN
ncbi:hypothetical protein XS81_19325 [Salmonella enterica subsp. diarizonae]|nr:hypothetical protein [Salmonella enterica subsp. diarizonae]EGX4307251.1 hypothetical protein [Salmonella enterica]